MSNLPRWEDVKDHPEDRMLYHKAKHDELLESLEEITRQMLSDATTIQQKTMVQMVRLISDGMVKCFEQMHCDVTQGCPGWREAQWVPATAEPEPAKIFTTKMDIQALGEIVGYAREQIKSSHIPVLSEISTEEYSDNEVAQALHLIDHRIMDLVYRLQRDDLVIVDTGD